MNRILFPAMLLTVASSASGQRLLTATQDLTISADKFNLRTVGSVHVSSNGTMALPQFEDGQIAFFDASGKYLGLFGRKGEGPGEFRGFSGFSSWKADTFVAIDAANNRITLISPALKALRMFPIPVGVKPPQAGGKIIEGTVFIMGIRADNSLVAHFFVDKAGGYPAWLPVKPNTNAFLNLAPDGAFRRVASSTPAIDDPPECTAKVEYGPRHPDGSITSTTFPVPLCTRVITDLKNRMLGAISLTPIQTAKGHSYRIQVIGTERGETMLDRTYPYTPMPLPKSVADSARKATASRPAGQDPKVKAYKESMPISKVYPPFAAIRLGPDGTVWLKEFGVQGATTQRWRALDPKGNELGVLALPLGCSVREVSRELVWCVRLDSEASETLVRYRIRVSDR